MKQVNFFDSTVPRWDAVVWLDNSKLSQIAKDHLGIISPWRIRQPIILLIDWLVDQPGGRFSQQPSADHVMNAKQGWFFENAQDAMLFKLTWA